MKRLLSLVIALMSMMVTVSCGVQRKEHVIGPTPPSFDLPESDREIAEKIRALVEGMDGKSYFAVVRVEKCFVGE